MPEVRLGRMRQGRHNAENPPNGSTLILDKAPLDTARCFHALAAWLLQRAAGSRCAPAPVADAPPPPSRAA